MSVYDSSAVVEHLDHGPLSRQEMAARVAALLPAGSFVNLGIGLPTLVADHLDPAGRVTLHTENGLLGMGPSPHAADADPDLINAGKQPVTELPGASYFHQADSFAMMRGGHIDVCVLGAFQVSWDGDLANWHTGDPDAIPAVGGAMDLATGAREVWVMMNLLSKREEPKLVPHCTYPLTAQRCVRRLFTDVATFRLDGSRVHVEETFGVAWADLEPRLTTPAPTVTSSGGRR
jgi:3-oxoadipate CoA-transferase beta subunit